MPKLVNVRVTSVESELEFAIHPSTTGKQLFDQVVKTFGIREVWFFGLQYVDARGEPSWISLNKKVLQHDLNKDQSPLLFRFRVKFYPEDAARELVQEVTQRLFYLEVKQLILRDEIYCSPETAVLLASYAAQVRFGDLQRDIHTFGFLFSGSSGVGSSESERSPRSRSEAAASGPGPGPGFGNGNGEAVTHGGADWLPLRVLAQHNLSGAEWEDKILTWWAEHAGLLRDDAMVEYLKIAQDLEMYGVTYFEIKNKKGTDLWLGIDALGLSVYERVDKLTPRIGFPWSEIKHVAFSDKKFLIESVDKKSPKFIFFASRARVNKRILALCMGNHELYMRRRKPESIEIQQMRLQAAEERAARLRDRAVYDRERRAREDIERQRGELEARLREYEARTAAANKAANETSERLRILEEKYAAAIREREDLDAARRHAEELHARLMREVSMEQAEKRKLLDEYERARRRADLKQAEVSAKEAELTVTKLELDEVRRDMSMRGVTGTSVSGNGAASNETASSNASANATELGDGVDVDEGEANLEMAMINGVIPQPELSRETAIAANFRLQERLLRLGSELRANRNDRSVTQTDRLHDENVKLGRDKFKTLKQIRQGNTKKRVDEFEAM